MIIYPTIVCLVGLSVDEALALCAGGTRAVKLQQRLYAERCWRRSFHTKKSPKKEHIQVLVSFRWPLVIVFSD
ncbi:MAG: hypothetical protein V7K89_14910 [Nostoc sp.]|uniref:hypothetical protein n=1 Tax=Nostoc sp. TaxID=1180 RepID=UPI002FF73607